MKLKSGTKITERNIGQVKAWLDTLQFRAGRAPRGGRQYAEELRRLDRMVQGFIRGEITLAG